MVTVRALQTTLLTAVLQVIFSAALQAAPRWIQVSSGRPENGTFGRLMMSTTGFIVRSTASEKYRCCVAVAALPEISQAESAADEVL
ncbi:hypothetical protein, partial [Paraburkholderia bengalensis]|uniref:hypothetical protein n=1 Tax=Paraburkholderia bengalensis TaxID=2747562 RepID=UPI00301546D8